MLQNCNDLHISNIFHKANIEVNEEGSEAAAATCIKLKTRSRPMYKQFKANHPYFYMIWNKKNILIAGCFVNSN